ncbi:MAG: ABC transporter substrate-binding protein [Actinomycetota bacterium]
MKKLSFMRGASIALGTASLVLATTVSAGAASTTGKFNAAAAKLVPAMYKGTTLQVGTDASYAPDESMSGTTMVGFDVDLINAIAKTLGITVNENNVTFDNILPGIGTGRYAIGNSSFTDNATRQKTVNFVDYFQAGEGVYAKAGANKTFKGLKSFCGLKVAVETGTVEADDAKAVKCTGGKTVTVQSYSTQTEANVAVSSGQADVGFLDSQIAGYVVAQSSGAFKLLGSAVNVAPYGIATAKTAAGKKFAKAIQAAVKILIKNGTYKAILKKYGVQAGALKSSQIVLNGGH